MRLVSLLIVLLIIALLVKAQLDTRPSVARVKETIGEEHSVISETPGSQGDIQNFQGNINALLKDKADQRARALEQFSVEN